MSAENTYPSIELNAGHVIDQLDALENLFHLASFRFDENGLGVAEVTNHGAVLADIKTTTNEQDTVNVDEPFYVRCGVGELRRAVRDVAATHDTVEFKRTDTHLIVVCGGPENHAKIKIGDSTAAKMYGLRPPEFEKMATVRVRSSYLIGVFKAMAHAAGDHEPVFIRAEDGELSLGYGRNNCPTESWTVPDHAVEHIEHDGTVLSWFSQNYLGDVLSGIPNTHSPILSWSSDLPVHVKVDENWNCWISPRLFKKETGGDS